jgi:hypothetical protein
MKKLSITLITLLMVSSVFAWTFEPTPIISEPIIEEPSKDEPIDIKPIEAKPVEIIDIDTGVKENMTVLVKDELVNKIAVDYALFTKTSIDTSRVEVISQQTKSCISFTQFKIDGVLRTLVKANTCQITNVDIKPIVKENPIEEIKP